MDQESKINVLGIYLGFMLILLGLLPLYVYVVGFGDELIRYIIYTGCSGGLGGTIYSIRGFYQAIIQNKFSLDFTWWYLFRPLISFVTGSFVYFFIIGGLLVISSSNNNSSESIMFYCSLSFLAGFSFSRFTDKLEEIATAIFSKKDK
ncbi:hypothetical protein [Methanococcus sp. CF]